MAYQYPSAVKRPTPGLSGVTQSIPNATTGSYPQTISKVGGMTSGGSFSTPYAYSAPKATGGIPQAIGNVPKMETLPFSGGQPSVQYLPYSGGTPAKTNLGMSASQAGYRYPGAQGSIPATVSKAGSTPTPMQIGSMPPVIPGTPRAAAAWINDPNSGLGGMDAYKANNIDRYRRGEISLEQLQSDANRVGYSIADVGKSGTGTGTGTATDYEALARAEYDKTLAELGNTAEGQKAGLTAAWERSNQILGGNRTLEDLQIDRTLNPFSGQTSYQKGVIGRERTLADESARNSYNSALGGIDAGVADAQKAAIDQITARAHQLEQADQQYGLDYAKIYGQAPKGGPLTMAAKGQGFDMGIQMADLTGHLPDGTKTSKQQQTEIENWWRIADQTGVIPDVLADMYGIKHGTPTQSAKQFAQNMSLQWSQEHRMNNKSSGGGGGGGGASFTSLMKVWSATGKAPKGLESYGINAGDPYQPGKAAALGAKDSADNYNTILDELQSPSLGAQAERQGVPAKTLARDLLNQNRDNLSDADYKAMNAWINENL